MEMKKFEELDDKIMEIIGQVGVVSVEWLAKALNVSEKEAREALEILVYRGDLQGRNWSGWYKRRWYM